MVTLNQEPLSWSNKSKMKILKNRWNLKGRRIAIMEDMAQDLAKRLKKLKEKWTVGSPWFANGKVRYKGRGEATVRE